jgi:hypothetical protein
MLYVMSYLISVTLALLATAALIGSFTLVERRLVSAIRWGRLLFAECHFKKSIARYLNVPPNRFAVRLNPRDVSGNWVKRDHRISLG